MNLPFFPDIPPEISRSWRAWHSAHVHNLEEELNTVEGLNPDALKELHRATDLSRHPLCFNSMLPTTMKPEQVPLLLQRLESLLGKGAIERVPLPEGDSGFYSQHFSGTQKKMGGCVLFSIFIS